MSKSIFISNNSLPLAFKTKLKAANYRIFSRSFIRFENIAFEIFPDQFNWIFFTSKRSVDFFLIGVSFALDNYKIACIGEATAEYLKEKGIQVEFCGKNAGNPKEVGNQFLSVLKHERVFFPLSTKSKKSISNLIPSSQKVECVVYATIFDSIVLEDKFDYLVFTSPSNAESFLEKNTIGVSQTLIAWGNSTRSFLEERQITVHHTLNNSSFSELENVLFEANY